MSQLPNAAAARIDRAKIHDYLLNSGNDQNRGKSHLFTRHGFERARWEVLAGAIQRHPIDNDIASTVVSPYGTKYLVRCKLVTPDGLDPCMVTVWIVEPGNLTPRLVTAY